MEARKEGVIPIGLALLCFCYYLAFLAHYGEMFYHGSDIVANTAYGATLFTEVPRAGWTVPKPAEMLLFGAVYRVTRDLWFIHLVLIVAAALTVWAGCRLILKHDGNPIGCIAFCVFALTLPRLFRTTLAGGPGGMNLSFLLLAVVCAARIEQPKCRILAIVFLSLANLSRPDSWPCTYLIVLVILSQRVFDRTGPVLTRGDLWFFIPLGMPLVWGFVGWLAFEDPLYSMRIAQTFAIEVYGGRPLPPGAEPSALAAYLPRVKSSWFDLFSVSGWFSTRAAVVGVLFCGGIASMYRGQPRVLLLTFCPFVGTLFFYLVYALLGTLFRSEYIYSALVLVALFVSAGLGSLCGLVRSARRPWLGRCLQAAIACAVLLVLTAGPFQQRIVRETIPMLRSYASVSKRSQPAIERLVEDVRRSPGSPAPVFLTTQWVPPSRIALGLNTGKDVYLLERLAARKRQGHQDLLPALEGRTVYFCLGQPVGRDLERFVRPLMDRSTGCREMHNREGISLLKCSY